tara:strand:+ start:72 stop:998 length:927 start_codon:yes stop_codon:yes gene_type:complete
MVNTYLIKRSPDLTDKGILIKKNIQKKGYSESGVNRPPSLKLNVGDIIYVSETNYGIYAKGKVIDVKKSPIIFNNYHDIINYFNKETDAKYCFDIMSKLKAAKNKNPDNVVFFHEYFINQSLLDNVVPLEGPLASLKKVQRAFSKIKEPLLNEIENPTKQINIKLNSSIPGALRQQLYSFFNKKYSISTWIDIDHFVPKSVGGPGNIIENLVPVGFSLNRYKSNSVPKGLFVVAANFEELKDIVVNSFAKQNNMFLKSVKAKDNAKKILSVVNSWENEKDLAEVKNFYKLVLKYHHPEYISLIENVNF